MMRNRAPVDPSLHEGRLGGKVLVFDGSVQRCPARVHLGVRVSPVEQQEHGELVLIVVAGRVKWSPS